MFRKILFLMIMISGLVVVTPLCGPAEIPRRADQDSPAACQAVPGRLRKGTPVSARPICRRVEKPEMPPISS